MDEPSTHVLRFLTEVSRLVWGKDLYHDGNHGGLWNKLNSRGLRPTAPRPGSAVQLFGAVALEFGVYAHLAPDRMIEFVVVVCPGVNDVRWEICTHVKVDNGPEVEEQGQTYVRSFPDRFAETLDDCLTELRAAVVDLSTCDDVLDDEAYSKYLRPWPSFSRGTLPSE